MTNICRLGGGIYFTIKTRGYFIFLHIRGWGKVFFSIVFKFATFMWHMAYNIGFYWHFQMKSWGASNFFWRGDFHKETSTECPLSDPLVGYCAIFTDCIAVYCALFTLSVCLYQSTFKLLMIFHFCPDGYGCM